MQGSGVRRSRSGVRDSKVIARLEEFAAACAQVRFSLQRWPAGLVSEPLSHHAPY